MLFSRSCQRTHTHTDTHTRAQRMPMRISFKGKYPCKVFACGLWAMTLERTLHLPLPFSTLSLSHSLTLPLSRTVITLSLHLPRYGLIFVHLDLIAIVGQMLHALVRLHNSHIHIIDGLRHFLWLAAAAVFAFVLIRLAFSVYAVCCLRRVCNLLSLYYPKFNVAPRSDLPLLCCSYLVITVNELLITRRWRWWRRWKTVRTAVRHGKRNSSEAVCITVA